MNAHSITYVAIVFATNVTMTFILGAIGIGWWYLFCLRHLIIFSAYAAIVNIASIFGMVGIGRWINKRTQSG